MTAARDGLFNVLLGSTVPLTSAAFVAGIERWLTMQVGRDAEMAPGTSFRPQGRPA